MAIELELGKFYTNRLGRKSQITKEIIEAEGCHAAGFRFRDNLGNSYKPNGSWSFVNHKTDFDLVAEA